MLLTSPARWPLLTAATLIVACTAKSAGFDPPPQTVADVRMSPDSIALVLGDSAAFTAQGHQEDGSPIAVTLAWSATGGTVSASGRYHAGNTPGVYRIMASTTDLALADTSIVTITDSSSPPPPTAASVQVTPGGATLAIGAVAAFSAQGYQANGTPIAVPVVWNATGGSISTTGQYHAGASAGSYRVIASTTNHLLADTSIIAITDTTSPPPPPTVARVQVTPGSATMAMGAIAMLTAQGYQANGSPIAVPVVWSATGGTVSSGGQYQAGATAGAYRVVVSTTDLLLADTALITITDTATPPPPVGTVLLTEAFEDASVAGRGWYDNVNPAISTVEHHGGSGALQMAFAAGGTVAVKGGAVRHKFAATDRVYLRYWVKYSANWVGSGVNYHPHEFHFVTNLDNDYVGPSATHLTAYVEHVYQNGGIPSLSLTDASNIDVRKVNVDLTHQTEIRSANGCNGNGDRYPTDCYQLGTAWRNEKLWRASAPSFTPGPGPGYKNAWHQVEAYFQLNSIQGGVGVADGITQYWFDGQLVIDHHDVLLRTGQYPSMQFTQFLIAPYIGVGSPVAQTMWVDDLVIATGPVP
ncbi:MAG: hypothetical protein ABI587_09015 [Gemmatimonadales bacterium]